MVEGAGCEAGDALGNGRFDEACEGVAVEEGAVDGGDVALAGGVVLVDEGGDDYFLEKSGMDVIGERAALTAG